eukprot:gene11000-1233_t
MEYFLVNILALHRQVAANIFTALKSAEQHLFRLATDGPLLESRSSSMGMFPVDGTIALMPTQAEVYSLVHNAQRVWDDEPVAFAVVVPRSVLRKQFGVIAHGYNSHWDEVETFIGDWGPPGSIALHLQGKGMTPVFSQREVSLDFLTESHNPGGLCYRGNGWCGVGGRG